MISVMTQRKLLRPPTTPSIREQTPWAVGLYQFPDESASVSHFNCGLMNWQGHDWLVTRKRHLRIQGDVGRNTLMLWRLENNVPVQSVPILVKERYKGENHEDPRVIVRNGRPLVSYCTFRRWNCFAHQVAGEINNRWQVTRPMHVAFGKNGNHLLGNTGHEKNWIWFDHDGQLFFIYRTDETHEVCRVENGVVVERTEAPGLVWSFGEARGGTPPIRVGDHYVSFFHSSTNHTNPAEFLKRYHMGAYAFEAKPPFRVVGWTQKPILSGSENDMVCPGVWARVVFPCGAMLRGDEFWIVGGSNDIQCFHAFIPVEEVLKMVGV
jgi:predicted GH43/DUF377 family glycosyl hydrolase